MTDGQIRARVDRALCSGHGRCAAYGPDVFELDEDGYAANEEITVPASILEAAKAGARACPERAITYTTDLV